MIKIRLQRRGRKKRPFYHIVVADSRAPRDGRVVERLGRFDNVSENQQLVFDEERMIYWLGVGAKPSETVRSLLKKEGILYKMHLIRWGWDDERIEAALKEWREAKEAKGLENVQSRKDQQKELLSAEEKAYQQHLEEKAVAAAKKMAEEKKAKEEAAAAEAAAEEAPAEEEVAEAPVEEAAEVAEETAEEPAAEVAETPAEEPADEPVAEEVAEPVAEETVEAPAEEPAAEVAETPAEEQAAEAPVEEAPAEEVAVALAEEPAVEAAAEEAPAEEAVEVTEETAEVADKVSTDMTAGDAINHIKDTDLKDLEGFVPESEERVTVLRAWEAKQG